MPRKIEFAGQIYTDEREVLRKLIAWKNALNNYLAGGAYAPAFSTQAGDLFTRLGRKYKYDREFEDDLRFYDFKSHSTRSRRT